jgi:hypothetical protein
MTKSVDLLSYWMPLLKNLKEFKEIAKAEEPELIYLLEAVEQTLANMFIDLANESGIVHFEKILGIIPEKGETLETRRFRVLSRWNRKEVYTDETLEELLISFCGEGKFEIVRKYEEYFLKIITQLYVKDAFEIVYDLLQEILPCNLVLELSNAIREISTPPLYFGGVANTAMLYVVSDTVEELTRHISIQVPLYNVVTNSIGINITVTTNE